jgi:hypothetical protein
MNNDQYLLNSEQASKYLGVQTNTLKQSRHTGILLGEVAPRYLKMGRSTRYTLSSLLEFRSQFPEYTNTSQYKNKEKPPRPSEDPQKQIRGSV